MDEQATIASFSANMDAIVLQTILKIHRDAIKSSGASAFGAGMDALYFDYLDDIENVDTYRRLLDMVKLARKSSAEATNDTARAVFDRCANAMDQEAALWQSVRAQAAIDRHTYTCLLRRRRAGVDISSGSTAVERIS